MSTVAEDLGNHLRLLDEREDENGESPDIDPDLVPDRLIEIGDSHLISAWLRKEGANEQDEQLDSPE